ncbi:hypothetical protein N7U66_07410 [Lacinutrix neustonica]|uniref:Uncharacterized protein n=1 Tax=Lacinutrix neustonica TaxID=2980107 RepID=A0A9E8MYR0_9FLAO|nr:hypothetical protein [Lacinutrix neustonica]WAC03354.1 hypothetical protein N7U66_07410 [Lacinutrix neustonica]
MIVTLLTLANIAGGILLGLATLDKWDGKRHFFNMIASAPVPFQTVIGGILVILGLIRLFGHGGWLANIVSVLGGILLLTHVLGKAAAFGNTLLKFSDKLMPFKAAIGIALIVIGLITLF